MAFSIGIGIVTYSRRMILGNTVDQVRALTHHVGDHQRGVRLWPQHGTLPMPREKQVPVVTGVIMGVGWNRNRASFLLSHMRGGETVILLEDDTRPDRAGRGGQRHGSTPRSAGAVSTSPERG